MRLPRADRILSASNLDGPSAPVARFAPLLWDGSRMPRDIPVGNGRLLVTFDLDYRIRDIYFPHVGQENHTAGHAFRFGFWVDGQLSWVGPEWDLDRRYGEDSLSTCVRGRCERLGLAFESCDVVDFHLDAFVRRLR